MNEHSVLRITIKNLGYAIIMAGIIAMSVAMINGGWSGTVVSTSVYFSALMIATLLSRFQPYYEHWQQPQQDTVTDWLHLLISTSVASGVFQLLAVESHLFRDHFSIVVWPNHWPWYIQLPVLATLAEFGGYWSHRAMHTFNWLNRVHTIHHSAKRLYPLNATRNHPIDVLITLICTLTPLMMLGVSEENLSLLSSFLIAHLVLQHANLEFDLGVFERWLNLCKLHKWHHLPDMEKQRANFGNVLLVWDHVFGTYRDFNQNAEDALAIDLGTHQNMATDYVSQLTYPFEIQK